MNISKDKTDRLFAEKLGNHTVEPSAKAWAKLESKLQQKQRKIMPIWKRTGIAASLLILLFVGGMAYFKKGNSVVELETIASRIETPKGVDLEKNSQENAKVSPVQKRNEGHILQMPTINKEEKPAIYFSSIAKESEPPKVIVIEKNEIKTPEFMDSEQVKKEFITEKVSPISVDNQLVESEKPEELTIVFTLANFDNNSSDEPAIEEKNEKKPKYLSRFFKQLINAKNGDKVNWNEVGFKPAKVLARAENKLKSTKDDLNSSYQSVKNKTVL